MPATQNIQVGVDITADGSRILNGINALGIVWTDIAGDGTVTAVTEPWAAGVDPLEILSAPSLRLSMASDGHAIVAGAPAAGSGAAYVLSSSGTDWQITKLEPSNPSPNDQFGSGIAISNDAATVIVSAPNKIVGANRGKLYVYSRGGEQWPATIVPETEQVASPNGSFTQLGTWLSGFGDGSIVAVGADTTPNSFHILDLLSPTSRWTRITPFACDNGLSRSTVMSGDGGTVVLGCNVQNGVVFGYRRLPIPTITWTPPASIEYGTVLSADQYLNARAEEPGTGVEVPGTFTYSSQVGTVPEPPYGMILMTFTPATAHYLPVQRPWIFSVTPRTPVLQWNAPAPVLYPTSLSDVQLNASVNAPGTITYTPAWGANLTPGTHTLRAVFNSYYPLKDRSIEATVPLTVLEPPPPTGFTARVNGNSVTFRWQRPPGVSDTGFLIEGGVLPGQTLATFGTPSGATERQFTVPSGAFYVRVHALISGRKGLPSNEIRIFVNVPVLPDPPANLLGMVSGSEVALSWTNTPSSPPPTGLRLNVTGALTLSVPLPVGEAFTFPSVPQGTYTFTVTTVNANGASIPSNPVTLSFPSGCTGSPSPPSAMVATRNGNLVSVTWDAPATGPAVTGYRLDVTGDFVGSFSTRTRALAGRVGSGSYTLSVVAINSCGTSAATTPTTILVP